MPRKSDRVIRFSQSTIDALQAEASRVEWWDEATPGLMIRVSPTGSKVFYWAGRVAGAWTKIKLGTYPAFKIPQARTEAMRLSGEAGQGRRPVTRAKLAKEELSFHKLFYWWLGFHAKEHRKNWQKDERFYIANLAHWGSRKVSTIRRDEVKILRDKLHRDNGPTVANMMVDLVRMMYVSANDFLNARLSIPTTGIKPIPRQDRDRFLEEDELPKFFEQVMSLKGPMKDFFRLALFTGARRSNIAAMRWEHVDLTSRIWRIPGNEAKGKRTIAVVLPQAAIDILNERKSMGKSSPFVLPSHGKTGHVCEPKHAMARILESSGLKDVHFHDLRRTLASWMAIDTPLVVIAKQLGHRSLKSTEVYARRELKSVRESVERAAAAMSPPEKSEKTSK